MPYRAMFASIITVLLALVAVGMWIHTVAPILAEIDVHTSEHAATAPLAPRQPSADRELPAEQQAHAHRFVQGTLLLAFLLICVLLIVGFAATFREWIRYRTHALSNSVQRAKNRTPYVDAWKMAADRMQMEHPPENPPESPPSPDE